MTEMDNSDKDTSIQKIEGTIFQVNYDVEQADVEIKQFASQKRKNDLFRFLGNLNSITDIAKNSKNIIKPNVEYAVKFTPELLNKMKTNDIQFLRDKVTDDILPVLYDYSEKGFGGQVRLELKGNVTNQDFANLSNSFSNLIEQKKYDALVEQVQQIYSVVKNIERGQENDRFAKVLSGRKKLLHALSIENDDELKRTLIVEAISTLCDGREQIELSIIDKLNNLSIVPKSDFKRFLLCFKPGYHDTQTEKYKEIQESFKYYCMSLEPLAYGYTCLNQPQMIEKVLEDCHKVFEHKNLSHVSSVEPLLNDSEFNSSFFCEAWYNEPKKHEKKLLESYQVFDSEKDIYIKVSGSDLLEALSNEEQ